MPRLAQTTLSICLSVVLMGLTTAEVYDDAEEFPNYLWYRQFDDIEDTEGDFAREIMPPSANQALVKLFLEYKNRDRDYHLAEKRVNSGNLGGLKAAGDRFEWLRRSPKSIIIGSIAAVTLFMGIALIVGIVFRRRYLLNKMATSRSPTGSIIGQETGDKKLAHSAQMYHYQFQKQQILAMEKASIKNELSDEEGTDVETDGDFTVYECAGVQPTNDMEVKNPLFEGGESSSVDGSPLADDELLNTSPRSSPDNNKKE